MAEGKKNKAAIYVVIAIIAIIVVFAIAGNSNNDNLTTYPVFCSDWITTPPPTPNFENCHKPGALDRQVFTVDTSNNRVIETSPDNTGVTELQNCTIVDAQHWSCGGGVGKSPNVYMLVTTQISRSGINFAQYGLSYVIFVTPNEWNSINNGAPSSN